MKITEVKQKMLIYIKDISSTNKLFTGEHTPKKRRVWLIVSNDTNNKNSTMITACPIYTRDKAVLPTQVFFKNGERNQVVCCENITTIPKDFVDFRGYVGDVSDDVFKEVIKAINIQMGVHNDDNLISDNKRETIKESESESNTKSTINNSIPESDNINISINDILKSIGIEKILSQYIKKHIEDKLKEAFGSNCINMNISTDINNYADNISLSSVEDSINPNSDIINSDNTNSNTINKKLKMPIDVCKEYCSDYGKLSTIEMYEKYKQYGILNDKINQSKKNYSYKQRIKQYKSNNIVQILNG